MANVNPPCLHCAAKEGGSGWWRQPKKGKLRDRDLNPGLPRDRRRYSPLYYRGDTPHQHGGWWWQSNNLSTAILILLQHSHVTHQFIHPLTTTTTTTPTHTARVVACSTHTRRCAFHVHSTMHPYNASNGTYANDTTFVISP